MKLNYLELREILLIKKGKNSDFHVSRTSLPFLSRFNEILNNHNNNNEPLIRYIYSYFIHQVRLFVKSTTYMNRIFLQRSVCRYFSIKKRLQIQSNRLQISEFTTQLSAMIGNQSKLNKCGLSSEGNVLAKEENLIRT